MLPGHTANASAVVAQRFGAQNATASATLSVSPPAATTTGDLLVATIRTRNLTALAPVTSVVDSNAADIWARAGIAAVQGTNADGEIWYVANAASLGTGQSITVTVGGTSASTSAIAFTVLDVTGMATSSPLDATATKSGNTQPASVGPTATTLQGSEVAISNLGWNGNGITSSLPSAGYTVDAIHQSTVSSTAAAEQAAFQILSATGAQTYQATLSSTSAAWTGVIATFKVSTGPPPTPTITSFVPTHGVIGAAVAINGTGLTGASVVKFNGTSQPTFTVNGPGTQITTTVPTAATSGLISVTTPGGNADSSLDTPPSFTVDLPPAPTITGFSPTSGAVGAPVTITGSGYIGTSGAGGVQFNGTNATYSVTDDAHISTSVPTGATTGKIKVTAPGGNVTSTATFTVNAAATPPHVLIVVEENQGIGNIIGSSSAPYINNLANTYASATNWYSVQTNSPNDYLELLSGSNQGFPIAARSSSALTLVDELHAKGIPWKGYMENMPSTCTTANGSPPYSVIHNPFRYFANYNSTPSGAWCSTANQNTEGVVNPGASGLVSALNGANAPDFAWITPNDCNDMHGASGCASNLILAGDNWLSSNIAPVISSPWFAQNGIIIITWDEGGSGTCCGGAATGGHIATIVVTSNNKGLGNFIGIGDHYGTLAAIEKAYGVPLLLNSANAVNGDLTGAFGSPTTPGSISGTVTDSVTTTGIGGATVCISTSGVCGSTSTTTASNGTYTLSNVAHGTFEVTASAPGYAAHSTSNVVVTSGGNTPESFALVPNPGSISGTVTDSVSAAPIAGATVCTGTDATCATFTHKTTTASDGTYSFSGLTEGSYQVNVVAANYVSQSVTNVGVTPGGTATKNVALVPNPGSITGTVKDSVSSTPISGATVCISTSGTCTATTTTTNGVGVYTLTLITEGSYQVTASAIGFSSLSATVPVAPGTATTQDFSLVAGPGTISGTVTDSVTGLPIGSATVCISTSGTCGSTTTTTAGDGTYTLSNVAPGTYEVTASAIRYVTQSRTGVVVTSGGNTPESFALVPNLGSISGTVTDFVTTLPIANATVCIGTDATCATFTHTTTTASDGTYSFSGLTEGSYQVNVLATNYVSQTVTNVSVTPGGSTTKDFALVPNPGSITGTVKDSVTSAVIVGATVCISTGGTCTSTTTTTDGTGAYTLPSITEGSYQVTASATGFSSLSATVSVAPGTATNHDFPLVAGHQPIFSDGFESGNFSAWTTNTGPLTIESTNVHAGTHAAESPSGSSWSLKKSLPSTYTSGYERVWFNVVSQTTVIKLLQARSTGTGTASSIGYVLVNSPTATKNPSAIALNVNGAQQSTVGPVVSPGSGWHELELYTAISGSTGSFTIWLDGTQRLSFTGLTLGSGSLPIAQMQLGDVSETADILFDDVAFDTQLLP
jgi:hypothetical protein